MAVRVIYRTSSHADMCLDDGIAMTYRLNLARIAEAARCIDPMFRATPQFVCETLSDELGARVVVKVETLNPVRCFKGRGADFYARNVPPGARIVTASSGNLGQVLAYACRRRGAHLVVEPSGAAGVAALLTYPERFRDRTVAVVLCAGNLTPEQMAAWL